MTSGRVVLALFASMALNGCEKSSPSQATGCATNKDCEAGSVCVQGECLQVCKADRHCSDPSHACVDGICGPCEGCRDVPNVIWVDGGGTPDSDPTHTAHHLTDHLVLEGTNLEGAAVLLSGGEGDSRELELCGEPSATRLLVRLPEDLTASSYSLNVMNQAGSCETTVNLLQGEQGPSGSPDTAPQIREKLLTVDGTGSAVDADLVDGLHATDLMPTSVDGLAGGTITGNVLVDGPLAATGGVTLGSPATCGASDDGLLRYNSATKRIEYCAASQWIALPRVDPTWNTQDSAGLSCKGILDAGLSKGDGLYWIDPNGGSSSDAFEAYCDMTTGEGGWVRVAQILLNRCCLACTLASTASGDPARATSTCSKYTDALINELATEKVFFSRVSGRDSVLFTKYDGAISIDAPPGRVVQSADWETIKTAPVSNATLYGSWKFFHQENWYEADRCLGADPSSARLSLEYINSSDPTYGIYACTGDCGQHCQVAIRDGVAEVFVR